MGFISFVLKEVGSTFPRGLWLIVNSLRARITRRARLRISDCNVLLSLSLGQYSKA